MSPSISIIIPAYNEATTLPVCLNELQQLRQEHCELIVVDGESTDDTMAVAAPLTDKILTANKGRAAQMNAGAQAAQGEILWFIHADSIPPVGAANSIRAALTDSQKHWGRFDVRLSGSLRMLRVVETMMNLRSRLSGIATGDQAIFVRRDIFEKIGGYPNIPLMEDIALCQRLKQLSKPVCLRQKITTSSRRWERHGVWRTIFLMWQLRLKYSLGVDPERLARIYYRN